MKPSTLHLPAGPWLTVLDCLCGHFPAIGRDTWLDRFARQRVLDEQGQPLRVDHPYREGLRIRYFREVMNEARIPFEEQVLYRDEHLLVVDKPHFLPVVPAGGYVRETLLNRLVERFENPHLTPLHRLDRLTAGLVLFSCNPETRDAYQSLFRLQRIAKRYVALAAPLPQLSFPLLRETRLERGEPFFRMQEVAGAPNSETLIEIEERCDGYWRYALYPVSGRKHQLRLHMAGLGAAILNDPLYPTLNDAPEDYGHPLQLLAQRLSFADPLNGRARVFISCLELEAATQ
ncbi:MAG TPA: pseudouridine synthase [Pseudomonas sp.]|nr:pseudouridine synthase [Pseudomonas sp.]